VILVFDEEDDDALVEPILLWGHGVVGVRQHAGLEDGGQILRRHAVLIRLGRKYGEQVEEVQQQLAVQGRQLGYELLVPDDGGVHVKVLDELGPLFVGPRLGRPAQWFPELLIEIQRHNWLREVVEVTAQDVGGIMDRVTIPD
jgi:hypothetical protein